MFQFFKKSEKRKKPDNLPAPGGVLFVIAGLGNPEDRYKGTRHNIGFETINKLSFDYNIPVKKLKHKSLCGAGTIDGTKILFLKPQTYMNRSGEAIKDALGFYKVPPARLIVIYDEVNLPLGTVRIREKGSAGGHNGIKDILYHLKTEEFIRIRIGIGPRPEQIPQKDFVLSGFGKSEHQLMIDAVTKAGDAIPEILKNGAVAAMNKFN